MIVALGSARRKALTRAVRKSTSDALCQQSCPYVGSSLGQNHSPARKITILLGSFATRSQDSSDSQLAYMRITSSSVEPSGRNDMSCSFGPSSLAK